MKELAFGINVDWTAPYWYDSPRSFLYGGSYLREPGHFTAHVNVLGLTVSIWYSK
jgi:hypothetical protein